MADWHVDFHVVPRRALDTSGARAPGALDSNWWTGHALPTDYQRQLGAVAPVEQPDRADTQSWGPIDGNRIEAVSAGGRVTSMRIRVDVRKPDSKFGAAVLQFVRVAGAVLVRSDGLVVPPDVGAFAAALRSADAWRFASDPATFLATYTDDED
jgi:hypothetical protein